MLRSGLRQPLEPSGQKTTYNTRRSVVNNGTHSCGCLFMLTDFFGVIPCEDEGVLGHGAGRYTPRLRTRNLFY